MGSKIVSRETFLLPVALQQLLRYPLVGQRAAVRLIVVADRLAIAGGFGDTHTSRYRGAEHLIRKVLLDLPHHLIGQVQAAVPDGGKGARMGWQL